MEEFQTHVVVPIYFLVWYNQQRKLGVPAIVVVPIYFLVWYNNKNRWLKSGWL